MDSMEFAYRVREQDDGTWKVHVMFPPPHIGTTGWATEYSVFEDLPPLLQERIAVLQLVNNEEDIKGVGRRHASVPPTYWVYTDRDIYA